MSRSRSSEPDDTDYNIQELGLKILENYNRDVPYALTRHHIDSYEQCIFDEIPSIIQNANPIVLLKNPLGDPKLGLFGTRVEIYFGRDVPSSDKIALHFKYPTVSLDEGNTVRRMFPNEARLRNLTYAAEISIDVQVRITLTRLQANGPPVSKVIDIPIIEKFPIFKMPILLRSSLCATGGSANPIRDVEMGECRNDYGGYFIIGGAEKILITRSEQAFNSLYVEKRAPTDTANSAYASVVSLNPESKQTRRVALYLLRPKRYIPKLRNNPVTACVRVAIPMIRGTFPLFILFRAMGLESDEEIVRRIFPDPDDPLQDLLIPSIEDAYPIYNKFLAINFIKTLSKGFTEAHVLDILQNLMLPHVPDEPLARAQYLADMVRELLYAEVGKRGKTDRDDMRNQRFLPTGTLVRELFNGCWKDWRAAITLNIDRTYNKSADAFQGEQIAELFTPATITSLFQPELLNKAIMRGFRGKWGTNENNEKVGVLQPLANISYLDAKSHTRRVVADFDTGMKITGPRKLHTSQFGYFCTSETPTGAHIGVTKNMSMMTQYSLNTPVKPIYKWMKSKGGLISVADTTAEIRCDANVVQINGGTVGFTMDPFGLVRILRLFKWTGCLSPSASICFNTYDRTVRIQLDEGRPIRPLWHLPLTKRPRDLESLSWNQLLFGDFLDKELVDTMSLKTNHFIDPLEKYPGATFNDYVEALREHIGSIEYVDPTESNEALISFWLETATKEHTHAEIHPSTILGLMASMIPFSHHNQAPRNQLSNSQSKQGIGNTVTNFRDRYENYSHQLCYGEAPLCRTFTYETIANGEMPYGFNCIIAATSESGYNQDDGLIINRDSVARGMFRHLAFRSYDCEEEEDPRTKTHSHIANPGAVPAWGSLKPGCDYSLLDKRGIIREGEIVDENTILVGRYMVIPETNDIKDVSVTPGLFTGGRVDSVVVLHQDGHLLVKIRIIEMRVPELGDKFSSRHGQKGTIGMLVDSVDLPRTADGIVPDVMVNPGGLISRMTCAQLVEMIGGRLSAEVAAKMNATTFCNGPEFVEQVGATLTALGAHHAGDNVLYSGITGAQIATSIFMCPLYFMRLKHLTADKVNARGVGKKEVRTHQPTGGRANEGGLRIGEMERDSLIAHGISSFLQESMMRRGDATDFWICNGCGRIPIFNDAERMLLCTTCDGPVSFSNETMRIQMPTKQSTATFTRISIPYTLKLLDQELTAFTNTGFRFITSNTITRLKEDTFKWSEVDMEFKAEGIEAAVGEFVDPAAAEAAVEATKKKKKTKGAEPATAATADKAIIESATAIRFSWNTNNEFKVFSNSAPTAFRIVEPQIPAPDGSHYPEIGVNPDGSVDPAKQTWPSVEHFYYAMMFAGDLAWQEAIRMAETPIKVKVLANSRQHIKRSTEDWEAIKLRVMKQAIRAKFEQNPEALALLLSTGDRQLIEATSTDEYWSIGRSQKGENKTGQLLMEVRKELRDSGAGADLPMAATRATDAASTTEQMVADAIENVVSVVMPGSQAGGGGVAGGVAGGGVAGAPGQSGGVYLFINAGGASDAKPHKNRDRGWGKKLYWEGGGSNQAPPSQSNSSSNASSNESESGSGSEVLVEKLGA